MDKLERKIEGLKDDLGSIIEGLGDRMDSLNRDLSGRMSLVNGKLEFYHYQAQSGRVPSAKKGGPREVKYVRAEGGGWRRERYGR